jgi:hypothetical protein
VTHHSDRAFWALHVVRIRGRAPTESVDAALGGAGDAAALLEAAAGDGLAAFHEGRAAGWSLTPSGREQHAELLAAERSACPLEPVGRAYDGFLALNHDVIELCSRWQVRPDGALNDHTDDAYDAGVIAELAALDSAVQPVCADLASAMDRFGTYGARLATSVEQVRDGATQWFTSPAVDSFHTVWFELHEDLLQTLAIPRSTS